MKPSKLPSHSLLHIFFNIIGISIALVILGLGALTVLPSIDPNDSADLVPQVAPAAGPVAQADFFIYLPLVYHSPSGWFSQTSGVTNVLYGVDCADGGQYCMAVGQQIILKTNDGGSSWSPVTPSISGLDLKDVSCSTTTRCVAVGKSSSNTGLILVTTNGGTSWSKINQSYRMDAVDCISADECVAVGDESEARFTYNGGSSWQSGRLGNTPLYGVDCISSKTCWMVGVGGRVIGTYPNAGGPGGIGVISKKDLLLKEGKSLLSISCLQQDTCVTVGEIGKIFKTTNTGGSWSERSSGTSVSLPGVSCPDETFCYAVGDSGTILASSDGGSSWSDDNSPTAVNLKDIHCFGSTTCLAVGVNGTILQRL
ncbi:MAG: hypothetical protein KDJ52_23045 [Anaerolineae bacterium]|nr:hypothetical protein [Anaerolineae bacterium]